MKTKLPKFVVHDVGNGPQFICPVCRFEYVWIREVHVAQSVSTVSATNDEIQIFPSGRKDTHRGSEVVLDFSCENGHRFVYRMSFHKGVTFVEMDFEKASGECLDTTKQLWRD